MKYKLSVHDPYSKYIEIEMEVENITTESILFQLPVWRPGRYELMNFAKNVQRWDAFDEKGNELKFKKIAKDKWKVETKGIAKVFVRPYYFASHMDAGGCWSDSTQLYVNPVHCFLFIENRMDEACDVKIEIPEDWKIACGLPVENDRVLSAKNYHQLADSPFIASPSLQHHSYNVNDVTFHIRIQGECKPEWQQIEKDFKAFSSGQIKMMGDFPFQEYHFLIQVLPFNFYHGVEHANSTVLAIGPGYGLMNEKLYPELLGLASHELFHCWNIKSIRPVEMLPYNYSQENYSSLGYVYEGFTTYYGDLFLARSGFFSLEQYLKEISMRLQKHIDNYGKFNYSVAQSSFDTWLDGYSPVAPHRRVSIYDEGSLIALMLDLMLRKSTENKKSLDDVMRKLYSDFGKKNKGYSESDLQIICEGLSQRSFNDFFENYINKAVSYESLLEELISFAGLEIRKSFSSKSYERLFGFKAEQGSDKVLAVIPGSPAADAGLSKDDEIIAVNGFKVENNLDEWCAHFFENNEIILDVFTFKKLRKINLQTSRKTFYDKYTVALKKNRTADEQEFLNKWIYRSTKVY